MSVGEEPLSHEKEPHSRGSSWARPREPAGFWHRELLCHRGREGSGARASLAAVCLTHSQGGRACQESRASGDLREAATPHLSVSSPQGKGRRPRQGGPRGARPGLWGGSRAHDPARGRLPASPAVHVGPAAEPSSQGPAGHASPRVEAGRPCAGTVLGRVQPALTSGLVALREGHAGLHGSCQLSVLLREGDQRPRASTAAVTCTDEARHMPGNRALYRHRLDSCYFSHFMDEEAGAEIQDLLKATRPGPNSDLPGAGGSLLPPALPNCPHCLHSWSSSCHFRLLTLPLLLSHVDTDIFSPPSPGWSGV
ncbi:uncharacterized protein LOC118896685 [Balaenoptera musculus]|uniref:Uncharacterized protein LOC118896685 n=1 Tax=Balaenoptera musculus TaxID=9771 RepID=A0A8B8XTF4_BALMU|nr:uncharacterized protein LOC118896685 [Balaenoptera musculus]XP_036710753.1 uncharacterized protein LOC118896685 [Balaenoptera musculus]XP_036710754.1 uncharacterized protein LOC118896685 [Balaenoptera musculus]XP_036710755.1 uncharacterized protein LOC118896685 [Balaenoptera musculus]